MHACALSSLALVAPSLFLFFSNPPILRSQQIKAKFKSDYWNAVKAGLRIWPACEVVNQTMIPLKFRTVFKDLVGFFWDVYLMMVSSAKPLPQSPAGGAAEASSVDADEDAECESEDSAKARAASSPVVPITLVVMFLMYLADASGRQRKQRKPH
jgi:hypothetical protein